VAGFEPATYSLPLNPCFCKAGTTFFKEVDRRLPPYPN